MSELVSVIVPSYNTERFIGSAIESVLSQTYENWEMIVVDDASTDRSISVIRNYIERDNRILLIESEQNCGLPTTRNKGLEAAKGRYIAFLDSDDMWRPTKLEKQVKLMKNQNAAFSFTAYQKMDENGNILSSPIAAPSVVTYRALLRTCVIGVLTVVYDTRIFGKLYMRDIGQAEDYCLWLKILRRGHTARGINESLALYRIRKGAMSRNKLNKAVYQWHVYRQVEKLSFVRSLYYLANYAYYGTKKFLL